MWRADDVVLARQHALPVELRLGHAVDAVAVRVLQVVPDLGGEQHRLGGDAAPEQASAAQAVVCVDQAPPSGHTARRESRRYIRRARRQPRPHQRSSLPTELQSHSSNFATSHFTPCAATAEARRLSRICRLPGDVDAFADPLRIADLLHHEVRHIAARDAHAMPRQGFAVDPVDAACPGCSAAWAASPSSSPARWPRASATARLRGDRPLQERVVDDLLHEPAAPRGLLLERVVLSAGRAQRDDSPDAGLLHRRDDQRESPAPARPPSAGSVPPTRRGRHPRPRSSGGPRADRMHCPRPRVTCSRNGNFWASAAGP